MNIALLSIPTDQLKDFVADDELMIEPLRALGHAVEFVPWQSERVWRDYDGVVIRTTWDYQNDLAHFLRVLEHLQTQTPLANPLETVKWNADKKIYLRDIERQGAKVVPTIWQTGKIGEPLIEQWYKRLQTSEVVIKPTVGANAQDARRIKKGAEDFDALSIIYENRSYMVQPFMTNIVSEGEFSLFYFNGLYSHAILKTPKPGDFRVQEEHGGYIQPIEPPDNLSVTGEKVLKNILPTPLYARIDFVRMGLDEFAVMELELIEPSMYLRTAEHAPHLFAEAIDRWLVCNGKGPEPRRPVSQP